MRKIRSTSAFNIILNETVAGGLPRPDGRPGCVIAVRPGLNLVPDELLDHPYLRVHIDGGTVTLADVDEPEPPPRPFSKFSLPADRAGLPNPQHVIEPPPTELIGEDPETEH